MQGLQPTALPALLILPLWPLFMLLPPRFAREFVIVTGAGLLGVVGGPVLALGLSAAALAGYGLTELVARLRRGRRLAFLAGLAGLHVAYWACFLLPLPPAFQAAHLRPADRAGVFVLFSGIGLTFFRLVSYYHDRVRGGAPRSGLRDFLAYMLFFPQLRHGPLERCGPLAERLRAARSAWRPRAAGIGLLRVAWALALFGAVGFALRALGRAGPAARLAAAFGRPEELGLAGVLLVMHAPALVLYALESSAAHLQLGVARVFGVAGSENFRHPLLATSPRKLWRRWNITLSDWLRDYAYKPLGGGRARRHLNVLITFLYCGLLHGWQLRCLAWGLWSGGTLALGLWLLDRLRPDRRRPAAASGGVWPRVRDLLARLATFHWFAIGVTIIADPDTCGLRILARYVQCLARLVLPGT